MAEQTESRLKPETTGPDVPAAGATTQVLPEPADREHGARGHDPGPEDGGPSGSTTSGTAGENAGGSRASAQPAARSGPAHRRQKQKPRPSPVAADDAASSPTWHRIQPFLVVLLVLVLGTMATLILLQSAGDIHLSILGGATSSGMAPVSTP